jgi:tetratricopeptide (TPR) repeat protein
MTDNLFSHDVFISYSHADAEWACDWLLPRLEAAGLRVCVDFRDFDLSAPSLVNIERAVDASRHTLLVLTPSWVASEWANFEALLAQTPDPAGRHRRLIPLLLQPCRPPSRIAMLTYADFTRAERWEAELPRVVATIRGELRLPELGPTLQWLLDPAALALHRVRAPVADFTGRDEEIAALMAHLSPRQTSEISADFGGLALISGIHGMGGVGKTELALVLAHRLAPRYPDAQLMFELQPGGQALPAEALLAAVLHAFQPEARLPDALAELQALYYQALAGKRGLLLLDNAATVDQVRPLLPPPAGWAVLVTSRRRFPLPAGQMRDLNALPEPDAVVLLERMLRDGGREDIVGEGDRKGTSLQQLAERCGRLPLALRLAAGYLTAYADWSLDDYLAGLEGERLKYLTVEGEPSIEAVLGLSVDALAREDAILASRWHDLAVFPAPFDCAAAAAVWDIPTPDARAALSALLSRSLLEYDRPTDTYTLHDLLRECTLTSPLLRSGEGRGVRSRHAAHYLAVGKEADTLYVQGGNQIPDALRRFDMAWPHLQAAWGWTKTQDDETALCWLSDFPRGMAYLLDLRLTPRWCIPILETALAAARRLKDRSDEGIHLGNLGLAYAALGDPRRAIECYEQALAIHRTIGNRRGEGNALGNLGAAYYALGDLRRAIEFYEQALAIARAIGDRRGEGADLGNLGLAYAALGDPRRAIECYEQALAIDREIGDRRGEGNALGNLGAAYYALGDLRRAIEYYEQALAIARAIGDRRGEGADLGNLGLAYAALGDPRRAIECYEQALAIDREIGDRRGEGNALGNLGAAYAALGEPCRAIEFYEQALVIARAIGDRRGEGADLGNLGNAYATLGDLRRAIEYYEQALAIDREIGDRRGEGNALGNLGNVYATLGDPRRAIECYEQALAIDREIGDRLGEANVLKAQGDALAFLDQRDEALARYDQALGLFRAVGNRLGEANVLKAQGDMLAFLARRDEALARYDQALGLFRAVGDRLGEANVLKAQGDVLYFLKRTDEALARYDQALGLFRAVGDRLGEANVLQVQGDVLAFLDRRDEALARYDQALGLFRAVGDRLGEANVLKAQGDVLAFLARRDEALARYDQALGLFRAVGDRLGEANVLQAQGDVLAFLDRRDEALARYDQALGLFRAVGDRLGEANVLKAQGDALAFLDQRDEAFRCYEQALQLFRTVGARLGEANTLLALGQASLRAGRTSQGMALLEQARGLYTAIGDRLGLSNVGIILSRHAAAQGDLSAAIEYMQPAVAFATEIGHPLSRELQAETAELAIQLGQQHEALGDREQQASRLQTPGQSSLGLENYQSAITWYNRAQQLYIDLEAAERATFAALGTGRCLVKSGAWYRGLSKLRYEVLPAFRALGNILGKAQTFHQIGIVHQLLGDYELAEMDFQDAIRHFRQAGAELGIAEVRVSLGHLAIQMQELDKAIVVLNEALSVLERKDGAQLTRAKRLLGLAREALYQQGVLA